MQGSWRLVEGSAAVIFSMLVLFAVPRGYFVAATFVSTSCMVAVSLLLGLRWSGLPAWRALAAGGSSAAVLYAVFYGGNIAVAALHPLGVGASSENAIYTLIASPGNPLYLQVGVLLFDAAGFESFFRGTIQARASPRLGAWAPLGVAAADSTIHLATMNPLWVVTTFVADLCWGLTYRWKGLPGSFTSHLLWDIAIFILFPIR